MSSRFLTAVLTAASVALATYAYAEPTTVKSSKSNTSDRMGGGGGHGVATKTTTVKSSKSNSSERMGGGGGVRSGGGAPAGAINLNRNGGRDSPSPGTR
jgi:hypothetical protein